MPAFKKKSIILENVSKKSNALSFYVTKTVLVSPKWFWSDQIDLDPTNSFWLKKPIWTRPIHFGHDQFILVVTKSLWSGPYQFGQTKTVLVT